MLESRTSNEDLRSYKQIYALTQSENEQKP